MHLKGTDVEEHCPVTTMFVDLEGSTRLGRLYPPTEVKRIKNAFIQTAIEVVKSFDGHVHRIMGDAVLAFFGGKQSKPHEAAIDGVNCAAVLQALVKQSVLPFLANSGYPDAFGIRIGLDYGPKNDVMWSSYGYPGIEEVTATSFYVDVASKLQSAAGRNRIMLGESLRGFLDLHADLLDVKTVTSGGQIEKVPHIMPNFSGKDGKPINYRQHLFEWEKYLEFSPLATYLPTNKGQPTFGVTATIHHEKNGPYLGQFYPTATLGPKDGWLCFSIPVTGLPLKLPYRVRCTVENHGSEAGAKNEFDNHVKNYDVKVPAEHRDILHWESLAYRGLHYLTVEVRNDYVRWSSKFGVYVE